MTGEGGSYLCPTHTEVIDAIRDKYADDEDPYGTRQRAAEDRGERPKKKKRLVCTVPGCDETRRKGHVMCVLHEDDLEDDE